MSQNFPQHLLTHDTAIHVSYLSIYLNHQDYVKYVEELPATRKTGYQRWTKEVIQMSEQFDYLGMEVVAVDEGMLLLIIHQYHHQQSLSTKHIETPVRTA